MLNDDPSLSEQPADGLNGPGFALFTALSPGGLLLCRHVLVYIECGRFMMANGIVRGGGIDWFWMFIWAEHSLFVRFLDGKLSHRSRTKFEPKFQSRKGKRNKQSVSLITFARRLAYSNFAKLKKK